MSSKLDDRHISRIRPLIAPAILEEEIPLSVRNLGLVETTRRQIEKILDRSLNRLIVVVGPCSIHDTRAALEYASRLSEVSSRFGNLLLVMRVYFEKPRTVVGWKGLINDPDIDNSYNINKGLRLARQLLADINEMGLPCGTEFLDTTFGQYYADLVSWGAIGARTAESQIHRELASGLSMPVGIKNRTDGDIQVAVDGICAARHRHLFPTLTKEGAPAIYETGGNPWCHLILRGGERTGPNYHRESVDNASKLLRAAGLADNIIVDASHGNSQKNAENQKVVVESVCESIRSGTGSIVGVMLESHLKAGRVDYDPELPEYGISITDACLSLEDTLPLLTDLNDAMVARSTGFESQSARRME